MGPVRLYMSMSLDGFIAGPDDREGQELGRGGGRLFNWLDDRMSEGPSGQVFGEAMATGAVISGRRTFELAGRWRGDHHDGVPIFVLTHRVDDGDVPPGSATFVTDVAECVARARAAAGDRAVLVHGAGAAQALLRAGLLDEMEIHLVPVLLGEGRRLFDTLGPDHIELELVRRLEARDVTHLRYRIRRRGGERKTLHTAYRVTDLAASLDFYSALGYRQVGRVDIGDDATLTLLKFPGDQVVTLELVHRPHDEPVRIGTGFSHLVVQVDDLAATSEVVSAAGLRPGPMQRPGGSNGLMTSWLTDPDGYRIQLVQWPPGHPAGITAADFKAAEH